MNIKDTHFIDYLKAEINKPERGIKPKAQELILKLIAIIEKQDERLKELESTKLLEEGSE